jgi:3-deoxy-D-manno-octulosonic-acid transferase
MVLLRNLYSLLFYLVLPAVWLRLMWRSVREPNYAADMGHRLGHVPRVQCDIWIHAVSAGETIASVAMVEHLLSLGYRIVVTNMTPTGRERVRHLLGDRVINYYAPYDVPHAVRRFLSRTRPRVLVVVDTELWPNMFHYSATAGVKVLLVNARLSARSARGYQRVAGLTRAMMHDITAVAAQSEEHGQRFLALGLPASRLRITGSIKFDNSLPDDIESRSAGIRAALGEHHRMIAASTHAGEESILLDTFSVLRAIDPGLQLILAPRHPHRGDEVYELCLAAGFRVARRSHDDEYSADTDVLLVDTLGELAYFYAASDVAFVGGSLVPVGGHNFVEAVMAGVPVVMGPHLDNIEDIARAFTRQAGMVVVADGEELSQVLTGWLQDASIRLDVQQRATRVYDQQRGALKEVTGIVTDALQDTSR